MGDVGTPAAKKPRQLSRPRVKRLANQTFDVTPGAWLGASELQISAIGVSSPLNRFAIVMAAASRDHPHLMAETLKLVSEVFDQLRDTTEGAVMLDDLENPQRTHWRLSRPERY